MNFLRNECESSCLTEQNFLRTQNCLASILIYSAKPFTSLCLLLSLKSISFFLLTTASLSSFVDQEAGLSLTPIGLGQLELLSTLGGPTCIPSQYCRPVWNRGFSFRCRYTFTMVSQGANKSNMSMANNIATQSS